MAKGYIFCEVDALFPMQYAHRDIFFYVRRSCVLKDITRNFKKNQRDKYPKWCKLIYVNCENEKGRSDLKGEGR